MAKMKSRAPNRERAGLDPDTALFYEELIIATSRDVAHSCNRSDSELSRDIAEMRHRLKFEGIAFLTTTLPSLGKALDRALSRDTVLNVTGFKLQKASKLPAFMGDVFLQVFSSDGTQRSDASEMAVMAIRQVTYLFYKLNLPFTDQQENDVIRLFLETDENLDNTAQTLLADSYSREVIYYAGTLVKSVLAQVDPHTEDNFFPKHGPGAVSTGESQEEKPVFKRYISRLAECFPYEDWFYFNSQHLCDELNQFKSLDEIDAGTAKVVLVPKDSRGPRLISCEPLENQWIQQGLMRIMVKTIEDHRLTRGLVNFTSQEVNQRLALEGSLNGATVTLDMKEASDRVSIGLVKALFPTRWFDALWACRSDSTLLPNGDTCYLNKFAPMGSACCFPIEALCFWALSVSAIKHDSGKTPAQLREEGRAVYVYGDDIICAAQDYGSVSKVLSMFGLKLNEDKCCIGSSFRESCGTDAFNGVVVTPLRIRALWTSSLAGTDYISWVALHNAANQRCYFHLCDTIAARLQRVRRTPYSDSEESETIALVDCRKMAIQENKRLGFQMRFNTRTCYLEIRSWKARIRLQTADVPGWAELLRIAALRRGSPQGDSHRVFTAKLAVISVLAPYVRSDSSVAFNAAEWIEYPTEVTAYQYPVSRRVSLKRDWTRLH